MKRRSRLLAAAAVAMMVLVAVVWIAIHAPPVQRRAWDRIADGIEGATGWQPTSDRFRFRLWPAQVVVEGLSLATERGTAVAIRRLELRWGWLGILRTPRRVGLVQVEGLTITGEALELPRDRGSAEPGGDPWTMLEIEAVRVIDAMVADRRVGFEMAGFRAAGSLLNGRAEVQARAADLTLIRGSRALELGPLEVRSVADRERVVIEELDLDGEEAAARAAGELVLEPELEGRIELELDGDLRSLAAWWDPNLASGLEPGGRLMLEGSATLVPGGGVEVDLRHVGRTVSVAGYEVEDLRLRFGRRGTSVEASGPAWGRMWVTVEEPGAAEISARLEGAPADRLLAFAAPDLADAIQGPVTLDGELEASVAFPVDTATLAARFDLAARWREGRVALVGHGEGSSWTLERLEGEGFGAELEASGSMAADGALAAELQLAVPAPNETVALLAPRLAAVELPAVGGGPLAVRASVDGSLAQPRARVEGVWHAPELAGRGFVRIAATAAGGLEELEWTLEAVAVAGARLTAEGTATPRERRVAGSWNLEVAELAPLAEALLAPENLRGLRGQLEAEGIVDASGGAVQATAALAAVDVGLGEWTVDSLRLDVAAARDRVELRGLAAEALGGRVEGSATVGLAERQLEASLSWSGIDLGTVPVALPPAAVGRSAGMLHATGSLEGPEVVAELRWEPSSLAGPIQRAVLRAEVAAGRLEIRSDELATAFGGVELRASVPLGGLGLPEFLWPTAPAGAAHATVKLSDFSSMALIEAMQAPDPGFHATADLSAELWWDPQEPGEVRAGVRADGLDVRVPGGALAADGPLVLALDGGRLEIEPFVLEGLDSRIELEAVYVPSSEQLVADVHATVSPQLTRVVPLPLRVRGPLVVDARMQVPVAAGLAPGAVRGSLSIDHLGGSMVMRDPAVQVRDLQLTARLTDRGLDIVEGAATVNGGRVDLGGGWEPENRQGIVVGLEDVAFLVEGILTSWDGQLAFEPSPGRTARVTGDLSLKRGVWEENVDLAGVLLGGDALEMAADDPLHDIALDVAVHGRAGIEVANNLGQFNASWTTLRVDGSAAEPRIRGEVRIEPGGVLALGGQEVRVGRGSLRFTGDPAIDPILEIVPESDLALLEGFDPTVAATRGLAQGITSALGFENTTLQPAEIAVQTEKDPSSRFLVGRRLSRNLALFFATDLSDVQDRTTMLQAWNFTGLRGLIVQGYQETLNDELGGNVLQRFRWGGPSVQVERRQIFKIRFEGDWPLGTRALRRATGLRRGQPYDPFLLFVAGVRLERELAAAGYQEAVVDGRIEGGEHSPTLVFRTELGRRVTLEFVGFDAGKALRREATALYTPPPGEAASFDEIRAVVVRQLAALGFPYATASVVRSGDLVRVHAEPGEPQELRGPVLTGLPGRGEDLLGQTLRSPAALAAMLRSPEWAARAVERELAVHGYLEAEVEAVDEVPLEPGSAQVLVTVRPGRRAVVGRVVVAGEDPLGLVPDGALGVREGDPLDRQAIERAVRDLRDRYEDRGYRNAAVQWSMRLEDAAGWVVEVTLAPGRQRTLGEVRFEGTRHTSPRVLARGLSVEPGELLTDRDIDISASKIANFDPVERVEVRAVPVGTSEVDLQFDVTEKPRWRAEVGAGWSSERGASATFGIRDEGLLGRGVGLDLRGSWSSPDRRVFLVGSVPTVPGGRLSFITTLGYREGDATDQPDLLAQEEILASLEAQYLLRGNAQVGLYYRWTDTRTFEKEPDPFDPVPLDVTVGLGILGTRLVIDRFDDLFDPRSGWGLTTDLGWSSGAFGSDFDYLTSLTNFTFALEPFSGATWVQSLRLGAAEPLKGQNLIREARFFAGGQSSLRGFDLDTVGPLTFGIDFSLVPAGGGALFILNEELRIPVWGSLRGAVFADVGQVWESWGDADLELSVGVGLGVRWSTPIGPLWADVAWPVSNVGISSDKPKFYLGIGRPF